MKNETGLLYQTINEDELYCQIGRRLRFLRKICGLSQVSVATQLGITFQQVQKYELGVNKISLTKLELLAKLYGVSFNEIRGQNLSETAENSLCTLSENDLKLLCAFKKLPPKQAKSLRELACCMAKEKPEGNKDVEISNKNQK